MVYGIGFTTLDIKPSTIFRVVITGIFRGFI